MPDAQTTALWAVVLGVVTLLGKSFFKTPKDVDESLDKRLIGVETRVHQLEIAFAATHTKHDVALINLEEKFASCMEALERVTDKLDRYMDMRNGVR